MEKIKSQRNLGMTLNSKTLSHNFLKQHYRVDEVAEKTVNPGIIFIDF
jgi:hypothetical protein